MRTERVEELRALADKLNQCAANGGTVTLSQDECRVIIEGLTIGVVETARRAKLRANAGRPQIESANPKTLAQRRWRERAKAIELPALDGHTQRLYFDVRTKDEARSALVLASTHTQARREMAVRWDVRPSSIVTMSRPDLA